MHEVNSRGAADVLVHEVNSRSAADLLVCKVDSRSVAKGNDGLWFLLTRGALHRL
ncbi:MAG: DUF6150 family protein [Pseudomonadota bacterium]